MKNASRFQKPLQRASAYLLSCVLLLSLFSFPGVNVLQTAVRSFAAAETEPVVIAPTYTYRFNQKSYDKLLKMLNRRIKGKQFPKLAVRMLRDILYYEMIYYPQWRAVYPDFPTTAAYVKENLIDVIPLITKIKLINLNTREGRKLKQEVDWVALTSTQGDVNVITMFYDVSDASRSAYAYEQTLATLAHEIRHVRDYNARLYTTFPTGTLEKIFIEGASNFHERHVLPMATYQGEWQTVTNSRGVKMMFDRETGGAYPYYQSFFDCLVFLAGYAAVDAVGEGKRPETVRNAIAKRYGEETAETVWRILQKLPSDPQKAKDPDKLFFMALKLFRLLNACVTRDIRALDKEKPEEIRAYMDIFRNFKNKVLPYMQDDTGKVVTDSYFNTRKAEQILINKILASGALPQLYEKKALNRQAIREMLYCDEYEYRILFSHEYLPPTIAQTNYTFSVYEEPFAEGYEGLLTMSYQNEQGTEVLVYCYFDGEKTRHRDAEYPWTDALGG